MPTQYTNTIILPSDSQPIQVKILGLWELDDKIPITFNEEFTYQIVSVTGETYTAKLDLSRFEEPPEEPSVPMHEAAPGSIEWHDWRNYHAYRGAVEHGREMQRRLAQYMRDVTAYVIKNCLSPEDRQRIADVSDHNAIVTAAVTPRVTKEYLSEALRQTFPGNMAGHGHNGMPVPT